MEYVVKTISCIGAGYVGGPTMAGFAEHCKNLKIVVSDINEERIKLWNGWCTIHKLAKVLNRW